MGLLTRAVQSPFLLKRLLVELRGLRRATERLADAQELRASQQRPSGGQAFRGFSRERTPSDGKGSAIAYVMDQDLAGMLRKEQELRVLLGRDPTDLELERAFAGDVE